MMPISQNSPQEAASYHSRTESGPRDDRKHEIAGRTWQFPSIQVARMLSPKKPKPDVKAVGELLSLDQYDCLVDGPDFQDALNDAVSRLKDDNQGTPQLFTNGCDLVAFLARCVDACHGSLDEQPSAPLRHDRWLKDIRFVVRNAQGTSAESVSFELGATAGHGSSTLDGNMVYQGPSEGHPCRKFTLPVEVGCSWEHTVSLALDDAHHLFGASQARSFALVLAFNRDSKGLRFLIFYHGGLTASEPCDLRESGGLTEAVRIFLALASWTTSSGAGFIPSCTDTVYALPADHSGKAYMLAAVDGVLSQSLRIAGRMTLVSRLRLLQGSPAGDYGVNYVQPAEIFRPESGSVLSDMDGPVVVKVNWQDINRRNNEAKMYRDSNGRFGTIPHVCSYEGVGEHREIISNILFLPQHEDITKRHWPVLGGDPPEKLGLKTLWFTVFGAEGQSLVRAKCPRQLSRAWVHSVLGWLSIYLSGYMHQDISIGNVLMVTKPVKQREFEVPEQFLEHLSLMEDKEAVSEIRMLCERVKELVVELGISDECTGFVTDGDLAIPWKDCFSEENKKVKWGTPAFISRSVSLAAEEGEPHVHSPVDDLESCFFVAFWSVFFNEDHEGSYTEYEQFTKKLFMDGNRIRAVERSFHKFVKIKSDIVHRFLPVFNLLLKGKKAWDKSHWWSYNVLARAPEDAGEEYFLPHFHRAALQGVVDILEAMLEHWNGEIGWESWTGPS